MPVGFSNCGSDTTNYAPQWSGGSATFSSTKGIPVKGGTTTSGVDPKMMTGGSISGGLTNTSGKPLGGLCVTADSQNGSSGSAKTSTKGTYSVLNLPTGAYTVNFCGSGTGYVEQTYRNDFANPVSVVLGHTTTEVDGTLILGGKITGHVTNSRREEPVGDLRRGDGPYRRGDVRFDDDLAERQLQHRRANHRQVRRRLFLRLR